jgi:hypothetical protein
MNSRRFMIVPTSEGHRSGSNRDIGRLGLMSALGQKRTFAVQNAMSASPSKADPIAASAGPKGLEHPRQLIGGDVKTYKPCTAAFSAQLFIQMRFTGGTIHERPK